MPTAVDLVIKGLALCFYRDQFWNVVFICDSDHPSEIKRSLAAPVYFRKDGSDAEITFEGAGIVVREEDAYGVNADLLFNMSADYAHGTTDASGQVSNLEIRRTKNPERDVVWMKVPEAVLRVERLIENDYYVQQQDFPGAPVDIIGRVAKEVIIRFTTESPVQMMMRDLDNPGPSELLLNIEPTQDRIELVFDNDCKDECTHNDFLDLYDVVYGGTKTLVDNGPQIEIKFAGGQVKQAMFNGKRTTPLMVLDHDGTASPNHGNCEVVGSKPAPSGG